MARFARSFARALRGVGSSAARSGLTSTFAALAFAAACSADDPGAREDPGASRADAAGAAVGVPEAVAAGTGGGSEGFRTEACPSWAEVDVKSMAPLPESPHAEAFDVVWRTLLDKHYDPTLACLDWPRVRESYGHRVAASKDAAEAYALINEMLGLLGQSHLGATPPGGGGAEAAEALRGPGTAPLLIRYIDGEAIVVNAGVDGHRTDVPVGSRIVTVRGESVTAAIEQIERSHGIEADGASSAGPPASEGQRAMAIGRVLQARISCRIGEEVELGYESGAGSSAEVVEARLPCIERRGERASLGNLRDLPTRVSWKKIGGTRVGYLAFNYWMVPMIKRVEAGLAELRATGIDGLVLDLRGNPGGVGAMSIPVARLFLADGGHLGRLRMRAMTQELRVQPPANVAAFEGPVVVLVDEGTASTSEIFAVGMRDLGRIKIVGGGPSAGMALPSLIETLPDGGRLQYVVGDYESPIGTVAEGGGVPLDLRVDETREAIAKGRDPVLDAGVALIERELGARDGPSPEAPPPDPQPSQQKGTVPP
jgi:carboxyl-terminal processing protease